MKIKLEKQHYQWGLTAFLVIICCFIVFFLLYRSDSVQLGLHKIGDVIEPLIYGMVMAYLLCPIYNFTVSRSYSLFNKGKYKFKHDLTMAKIVGTIISLAILLIAIAGVLWMIIPGLFDSIMKVIDIIPSAMRSFTNWVDVKFANLPVAKEYLDQLSDNIADYAIDFATNTLLPNSGNMAAAFDSYMLALQAIENAYDKLLDYSEDKIMSNASSEAEGLALIEEYKKALETGIPTGSLIRDALRKINDFEGATGLLSYDGDNEVSKTVTIVQYFNGEKQDPYVVD